MSASIRLSLKAAKEFGDGFRSPWALKELRRAIAAAERKASTWKLARKPKVAEKLSKASETKKIRAAVMERADFLCEVCGSGDHVPQLDHFWGRSKVHQSVENCWALCLNCHSQKSDNIPSAAYWLVKFINHAEKYTYQSESGRALVRLAVVNTRGAR